MNKLQSIFLTVSFLAVISFFTILNIIDKDDAISNAENRALAQMPKLSSTEASSFVQDFEAYYTDQFPYRDELIKLNISSKLALNSYDIKGYNIVEKNNKTWILDNKPLQASKSEIEDYANKINAYSKLLNENGKEVYYISTPKKENILDLVPDYSNKKPRLEAKNLFESKLNQDNLNFINLRDEFLNKFNSQTIESLYFTTDNHWNSLGAYEGFKIIMDKMNIPINPDDYVTKNISNKLLKGIYYDHLYGVVNRFDNFQYVYKKDSPSREYYLNQGNGFENVASNQIIATGRNRDVQLYRLAYTSSDMYYKVVNPTPKINKKLLIYRDSYHGATSWLLEDIFREVEVVDPRYIRKYNNDPLDIAKNTDADIVMFMFNDHDFTKLIPNL